MGRRMVIIYFAIGFIPCIGKIKTLIGMDLYGGKYEK